MATILIPLPSTDFDPTESAVPWRVLTMAGHAVRFATPNGVPGAADPIMLTGKGLGLLAPLLMADANGRAAYAAMQASAEFQKPLRYSGLQSTEFDALLLPGGHAPGMKTYLESPALQNLVVEFFASDKPVAAICHGVLLAARSGSANGQSVLHGRKTTALTKTLELSGWALTCAWMGSYYRTYPQLLQDEVLGVLASPDDFVPGPMATTRDSPGNLAPGFVVQDRNYLSARWPGDAHRFANVFATMLAA
nr:type 1 glutamine amidotransferase domain-containing protein [Rhodoferax sp.]